MELNTQEFGVLAEMINAPQIESLEKELEKCKLENARLRERNLELESANENMRFENHWLKQYILLSVDRVRWFFSGIHNLELLSAIKAFVLGVLPENASAEQIAYASKMMELPMDEPEQPHVVNIQSPGNNIAQTIYNNKE